MTGQEISSDFIIADLFAWLKSDHMPAAPVRSTRTPSEPSFASGPLSSSAARTMSFASRAAPARITAVWRSGEIETPARGGSTLATAGSPFSFASTASQRPLEGGIGDGLVRRVNDDRQGVAPEPVEAPVDQLARLNRLGAGRLPAGSRQRCLHARREDAETHRDHDPRRRRRRRSASPSSGRASRSGRPRGDRCWRRGVEFVCVGLMAGLLPEAV